MESNFTFLQNQWQDLFQISEAAETYLFNDPNASMIKVGMLGERIVQYIADYEQIDVSEDDKQVYLIWLLHSRSYIPDDIWHTLHTIRKTRNEAVHRGLDSLPRARALLRKGYDLCSWFMEVYGDWRYQSKPYVEPENIPADAEYAEIIKEHERKIKELNDKIESLRKVKINSESADMLQTTYKKYSSETKIEDTNLSVRAKNGLHRIGLFVVKEIQDLDEETLDSIRNVGVKTKEEILAFKKCIIDEPKIPVSDIVDEGGISENDLLRLYFKNHDVSVTDLLLSVRSLNALTNAGITNVSQLIEKGPSQIYKLKKAGKKSAEEIISKTEEIIQPVLNKIKSKQITPKNYLDKTDEENDQIIIGVLMQHSGASVSAKDILESVGTEMTVQETNKTLGRLMAENKIMFDEYGDYTLYCPGYLEVVAYLDDSRQKDILQKRIKNGKTLDEIGKEYGVSRERIRQIEAKGRKATDAILKSKYQVEYYSEDKYKNLFTLYEITAEDWNRYFGLSDEIYNYLNLMYKKGSADLEEAIDNDSLPKTDRVLIQKYLTHTYILDDGNRVLKKRASIEDYLIEKQCKELTTIDQFFNMYNSFICKHSLQKNSKLVLDDSARRSRENRLESCMFTLWEQGKQFRYYDVCSNDYTDLYDTLSLDSYSNIEISAKKLFRMYPETMKQYDIRNEYELHNLLRKTNASGRYHSLDLGRSPTMKFGKSDREYTVFSMMVDLAPITTQKLAEAIEQEYGFDARTVKAGWFKSISDYLYNGIYKIDYPEMSAAEQKALADCLQGEFYLISEISDIYMKKFPNGDPSKINSFNLKKIGFVVNRSCAVKGYSSVKDYFRNLLLKDDEFDITEYKRLYSSEFEFSNVLSELKDTYDIIETDRNKYMNFRLLANEGITKKAFAAYCDSVADFVSDEYFTVYSLKQNGFVPEHDFSRYGNRFFASLLKEDNRFNYQWTAGESIFRRTGNPCSRKDLIVFTVREEGVIHINDVIDQIKSVYNIDVERTDVVNAVNNTDIQYEYADGILVCDN